MEDLRVVYFPYYFAQLYLKSKNTMIDARHLENLFHDIRSRTIDGKKSKSKGKGNHWFQMALALELSLGGWWEGSLLGDLLRLIDKDSSQCRLLLLLLLLLRW